MRRIGVIGYGAIARRAVRLLAQAGEAAEVAAVLLRAGSPSAAAAAADGLEVVHRPEALVAVKPDLVIECAGHAALAEHGPAVLGAGLELVAVSAGALADDACLQALVAAAEAGVARLSIPAGAVGGLDALAAMRLAGLERVAYVGRKPPAAWAGSPAEQVLNLAALTRAETFYSGTARTAARNYPKNANVAATVALAGLGFERTEVRLVADPGAEVNQHEIEAEGATGGISLRLEGLPDPENPRTSALTAASVAAVALGRVSGLRVARER
jgi:aspartate dehydrogenase